MKLDPLTLFIIIMWVLSPIIAYADTLLLYNPSTSFIVSSRITDFFSAYVAFYKTVFFELLLFTVGVWAGRKSIS